MIVIVENFISNWLKDILVVFIVISFLEIILPKGKMKKFVNFIIGLLIIFVIISPFTDLDVIQLNMDLYTDDLTNSQDNQRIIKNQEARIKEVFTNSISEEVKKLIESNSDYEVVNVKIDTREEEETILIKEVGITVKEGTDNNIGEISIEQIYIGESNHRNLAGEYIEIEGLVADYLGVDRNIVYIVEND